MIYSYLVLSLAVLLATDSVVAFPKPKDEVTRNSPPGPLLSGIQSPPVQPMAPQMTPATLPPGFPIDAGHINLKKSSHITDFVQPVQTGAPSFQHHQEHEGAIFPSGKKDSNTKAVKEVEQISHPVPKPAFPHETEQASSDKLTGQVDNTNNIVEENPTQTGLQDKKKTLSDVENSVHTESSSSSSHKSFESGSHFSSSQYKTGAEGNTDTLSDQSNYKALTTEQEDGSVPSENKGSSTNQKQLHKEVTDDSSPTGKKTFSNTANENHTSQLQRSHRESNGKESSETSSSSESESSESDDDLHDIRKIIQAYNNNHKQGETHSASHKISKITKSSQTPSSNNLSKHHSKTSLSDKEKYKIAIAKSNVKQIPNSQATSFSQEGSYSREKSTTGLPSSELFNESSSDEGKDKYINVQRNINGESKHYVLHIPKKGSIVSLSLDKSKRNIDKEMKMSKVDIDNQNKKLLYQKPTREVYNIQHNVIGYSRISQEHNLDTDTVEGNGENLYTRRNFRTEKTDEGRTYKKYFGQVYNIQNNVVRYPQNEIQGSDSKGGRDNGKMFRTTEKTNNLQIYNKPDGKVINIQHNVIGHTPNMDIGKQVTNSMNTVAEQLRNLKGIVSAINLQGLLDF